MKITPFAGLYTSQLPAANNKHRLKQFRKFLGWDKVPQGPRVLDVGASNFIGRELGVTDFTSGDLNKVMRTKQDEYDVVLCFEVLNHLFDHGVFLDNLKGKLKTGGKLYLSTPKPRFINIIHGRGNYVEIPVASLRTLLEYKGFRIIRHEFRNPWPVKFIFYGFAQPIRWLLNKDKEGYSGGTPAGAPPMTWWSFGLRPPIKWLVHRYQLLECEKI